MPNKTVNAKVKLRTTVPNNEFILEDGEVYIKREGSGLNSKLVIYVGNGRSNLAALENTAIRLQLLERENPGETYYYSYVPELVGGFEAKQTGLYALKDDPKEIQWVNIANANIVSSNLGAVSMQDVTISKGIEGGVGLIASDVGALSIRMSDRRICGPGAPQNAYYPGQTPNPGQLYFQY